MNSFQLRIISRAMIVINKVANGERQRHYLDEFQRNLILDLNLKPEGYELSTKQNHQLNKISEKL